MTVQTRRPWLRIALAISVTLNLFLLGFGVARWLHAAEHFGRGERFFGRAGLIPHGAGSGGQLMHNLLGGQRVALREQRQQLRDAQRAVRDALVADPFEQPALDQALASLRQVTSNSQRVLHDALSALAPSLTPAQRSELSRHGRMLGGFIGGPERPPPK